MNLWKLLLVTSCVAASARACDLCAAYSAMEAKDTGPGWSVAVFEQYTRFATLQDDGVRVPDLAGQRLDSSVTQFIVGYRFNEHFGLQVNVPVVYRSFRRPEGFTIDQGTESGLGDMTLAGRFRLWERVIGDATVFVGGLAGVKFPTGSTDRLKEELHEIEIPGAPVSGVHGHDLALGSGSLDGLVGASVSATWNRAFATANAQYTIRSEGDFDYRYSNDFTWSVGPGWFLWLSHRGTLGLQCNVSGETKGKDTFRGAKADDTGITAVYVGPTLSFTWRERLSTEVGVDVPVLLDNTALQLVPDYRLRGAATWRF